MKAVGGETGVGEIGGNHLGLACSGCNVNGERDSKVDLNMVGGIINRQLLCSSANFINKSSHLLPACCGLHLTHFTRLGPHLLVKLLPGCAICTIPANSQHNLNPTNLMSREG